ncbi:Uncharacterized protein Rs2_38831 [Raphanus sativus]|nr:Uncharacterized protein Rs2_38831 [Raphanus sativus]
MSPTCFRPKISTETPIETKRKCVSKRIQRRTQRRTPLRPDRAKTSPTCFCRKISTKTLIETKRKTFRRGFKGERRGGLILGLVFYNDQAWLSIANELVSVLGRYSDRACLVARCSVAIATELGFDARSLLRPSMVRCSVAIATELVSVLGRYSDRACLGVRSL